MSWNVPVVVIPFLVFSGRAFLIIAWRFGSCRNASRIWLSAGIGIMRWLDWRSVAVWCQKCVLLFFF